MTNESKRQLPAATSERHLFAFVRLLSLLYYILEALLPLREIS
jgi:hypothetical protein